MVKKLYKHEFLAWLRVLGIIWIITLAVAGMHRVLQLFEVDTVYYAIINGFALFVYGVAVLVCLAAPTVFGVVRFYRNFFTGEGYLTFTLPATKAQLLWVKVATAVCFSIASAVVCLASGCIITAGEVFEEICKAAAYLAKDFTAEEAAHLVGWALEFLLLSLVIDFSNHLFYYTCICIGQLFRKNRVLAAVGVYFGFYVVTQILSSILSVVLVILGETGVFDSFIQLFEKHPEATIHGIFGIAILLSAISSLIYWLICHHVLRKRLNLE